MTLYQQAVSSYIQRPFCVAKCLLGNPKPLNCIRRMQATRFCKTLFGCAIGVRSHHGSTMITGFEVLPAQVALVAVSIYVPSQSGPSTHNQGNESTLVTFNTVSTSVKANKRVIVIISERSGFFSIRRLPQKIQSRLRNSIKVKMLHPVR